MSWFKKKVQSYDMAGMALAREMIDAGSLAITVEDEPEDPTSFINMDGDVALDALMKQTQEAQEAAIKTLSNSESSGD